jgi:hypothetical protein
VDNFNFGAALTLVGMGGTLLSLWLLTLVMVALKKAFPLKPTDGKKEGCQS